MLKNLLENVSLLENIYKMSIAVLLLCSVFSVRFLKKIKRERKLTTFEFTMYVIIRIAIFFWLTSFILLEFNEYLV
ncbi:TPA: hypothetical protein ACR3Z0_001385 [Bacillus thuringiensis]|jgi:uncharacterized protein with PQ loop repeat|uniref:Uncharacterized protein n=4 Tax=Bacillus cereus group TaxID=86661 RepID=A0A9X7G5H7_BACCE|nr:MULTISPECIES: hypothetical protein [Bacillus]ANN31952.1 hypothetical protein A9498_09835 [Bacillus thuringiensis serovar coreanensis]MCU7389124.1 hypothetical protein [Bacillus sp. ST24]HCF53894.1 hypothetical protein [Bacillus sp. (in: firmicutes)]AHZ50746.1 hypothetical protein YBT1520_10110 [Bacillus thuringiensis serovar kurstaki str. YBT-1520]AIE33144.1 hypothetical protein BTK_10275 [Bacillus thuringiensis serovar kurstaki str. HD-1]